MRLSLTLLTPSQPRADGSQQVLHSASSTCSAVGSDSPACNRRTSVQAAAGNNAGFFKKADMPFS